MEEREQQADDEVVIPDDTDLEDLTASDDDSDDIRGGVRKAGKGQQEF